MVEKKKLIKSLFDKYFYILKQLFKEKEEEWARMVFVQQLRQQQQHNDEVNRVKTLWKQERQVRVDMQKRVQMKNKELEQKIIELTGEIDKLKKQAEIQAGGDNKQTALLEDAMKKKDQEIESKTDELKAAREQITILRKEKTELEKNSRSQTGDLENEKRSLLGELNRLQTELSSIQTQNEALRKNIDVIRSGNSETRTLETQRFATLQANWEDLLKYKDEVKRLKGELSEKETELQKEAEAKRASDQHSHSERTKNESLQEKIREMEKEIAGLSDVSKHNAAIKSAVEKERSELEGEKKTLEEKIEILEKRLTSQKSNFEEELHRVKAQAKADLDSLAEKTDKEAAGRLEELRVLITQKDDEIRGAKERIVKLEDGLNEARNTGENLSKKSTALSDELEVTKKEKRELEKEKTDLSGHVEKLKEELKEKESSAQNAESAASNKINNLEKELAAHKEKSTNEINSVEASNRKLSEQIDGLKKELSDKSSESTSLADKLRQAVDDIGTLRNSESSLKGQVEGLNNQLAKEREDTQTALKERDSKIDALYGQMEKSLGEKDSKIGDLEGRLVETQKSLEQKLSEFQNSQTTIEKLNVEIKANANQFEREKAAYEERIATAATKDEKIMKKCKDISQTFTTLQKEMNEIKTAKIEQLEKMNEFFPNFKDLLTRSFGFHQNLVDGLMEKYKSELTLRRKYFNMLQDLRGNIRVFCRVRPLLPFEIKKGYSECITFPVEGSMLIKDDKDQQLKFDFDQVYTPQTSQEKVSEDTTEYVQSVMDGYNVSIFAYGQTGSGKTYTMNGPPENPGVNLRALKNLFKLAQDRKPMFEYEIKVSIFEIYNEEVRDLLSGIEKGKKKKKDEKPAKKEKLQHKILHLPDGSVEVTNLNWIYVETDQDVVELDDVAKANRTAGVTDMNAHSSRSHMLLVVDVKGFNVPANIEYIGKLYLVDLAGSERVKKSGATGQALLEAQNINQSLSALGNCMQALQQKKFVPYRDSTLTDIMTNALGGNAKTVMFINCCPTAEHAFETVSSLKFAERVGKVELGQAKQQKTAPKKAKPETKHLWWFLLFEFVLFFLVDMLESGIFGVVKNKNNWFENTQWFFFEISLFLGDQSTQFFFKEMTNLLDWKNYYNPK
ncbi:hypothetical protein RFI_05478 [Reticulomyxa filosa]|uniref:Kinesin motor domain-containing protein n=1 Tax=Reticulomyxa filosa TaxID=46433 RepID=X6P259_RETFI|nr:hypothetical protein RFI_05478 [Reticulomyxa filosa]|eukprot:ETO31642.1 hypothetical protein RFI_05478 [Reticulomyxa filosa]